MENATCQDQDVLLSMFSTLGLDYRVVGHAPVYTIEEALATVPSLDGIKTKNIFLRDAKGSRHFLVVMPHDRRVDLQALAPLLSATKLSMGSPDRLLRHLGVTPGAVSIFALANDADRKVELVVDEDIWRAAAIQGHPLRNTATVSMTHASLAAFLAKTGHQPLVLSIP